MVSCEEQVLKFFGIKFINWDDVFFLNCFFGIVVVVVMILVLNIV